MVHELKTLPKYFNAVLVTSKTFEVRKDDRDFQVDDIVLLRKWNLEEGYTGDVCKKRITYILGRNEDEKQFVPDGYIILGIK